ncbi:zinc ribbon domain-containing protein [Thermogemmatispora sp.]|uniref:zinc ribbon domain-containing protein n=1 Tax=Thermogemmatispora sp. TaxID=1968838 RepID=UPI0035E45792
MQLPGTCSYCGTPRDPQARFCTNCGAPLLPPVGLANAQSNRGMSMGGPPAAAPLQPMPDSAFQLASGSPGQPALRQVGLLLLAVIGGTVAALATLGLLAWFIPGLRGLFWCLVGLIALVLFLLYLIVRSVIRRTLGRLNRFW